MAYNVQTINPTLIELFSTIANHEECATLVNQVDDIFNYTF